MRESSKYLEEYFCGLHTLELEEEESDYYDDWEGSDEEVYGNYDSSSDPERNLNE